MRKKHRNQLLAGLLLAVSVVFIVLLAWTFHLDRRITEQFEGRRWTLPAQVYAEPTELYVGQTFSAATLQRELERLGYRDIRAADQPGSYHRSGDRIELMTRRFRFWDALQAPQELSITTAGGVIETMRNGRGEDVPIYRLDPLLIGSIFPIHGEDRVVVGPDEISPLLPAALKVVEDREFDEHMGVDVGAIARAAWVNLRAGQIEQGGSTLTQQLVKSYFLDNRRTFGRKIEEAVMAMLLEVHFSKSDLMNAYINEIYLGQDGNRAIHGFGLGSQFYFGKPLAELQLHEVALLVALVRGPSYYDPRRRPERAKARRDLVLKLMAEHRVVQPEEAQRAMKRPLGVVSAGKYAGGYYPAFLDLVRRTLQRDYREEDLTEAGLQIFTTLNPYVQSRAEEALAVELERLDKTRKDQTRKLEGVVVVTAPQNGEVMALVGGRQAAFDGFNRALDARRSIGSLVKPVIYLAALETGAWHAASIVEDAPVQVKMSNGRIWAPQNISHEFYGPVPLVRALSQSLNLATVQLGLQIGVEKVTREFVALGLPKEPTKLPSVLLGAVDVAPLDVAQVYNAFANGGFSTQLRAVRAVLDAEGEPLKSFALEVTPVADPAAVYEVNRMMVHVMQHGSGAGARAILPPTLTVAGKSGTSSDYRDSWFAGFSGAHLAVVWIGYDDNAPTGLTGSSGSLAVWAKLMNELGTTSWNAPLPEGLKEISVEFATGLQARPECGEDVIAIAVPRDVNVPLAPGCEVGVFDSLTERARDWWRGVIR